MLKIWFRDCLIHSNIFQHLMRADKYKSSIFKELAYGSIPVYCKGYANLSGRWRCFFSCWLTYCDCNYLVSMLALPALRFPHSSLS